MITVRFVVVVDTRAPWLPRWLEQKLIVRVLKFLRKQLFPLLKCCLLHRAIFGLIISANMMTAGHKISAMANTQWRHCMSSYFPQKSANFGAMPYSKQVT